MAEKKSMLVLYEFEAVFAELDTDAERGKLIMAMYAYERRHEEPEFTGLLKFAWNTHIKPKIDEMINSYQEKCDRMRENANKRWQKEKNATAKNSMQENAEAWDKEKKKEKDKDKDIPSNIQTTSSKDIAGYPQKVVDNSTNNAEQPEPESSSPSLDGWNFKKSSEGDVYALSSSDAFNAFREAYPRKQGALRDIQTAWVTATEGDHVVPGDLVMAARKYARACADEKLDKRYVKMPQNFISSGSWKQYIPKHLPSCPHCHGQGVYKGEDGMIMCDCDRRYGP